MINHSFECLIVTKNESLAKLYLRVLGRLPSKITTSGETAKHLLKASPNLRIVVLDYALQDRKGSTSRILKKVLMDPKLNIVVLAANEIQLKHIHSIISKYPRSERVYISSGLSRFCLAPFKLIKWKSRNGCEKK
jgi:hypothetical protein